ncbi:MAG: Flp family type IVb pilin [Alphaproteobacteria bacterium]
MKDRIKTQTYASGLLWRFASDQDGSTAIEYALIAVGIGVAIIISVNGVGGEVLNMFQSVKDAF